MTYENVSEELEYADLAKKSADALTKVLEN